MPRLIVQSDWDEVLRENGSSAWVTMTYKNPGCASIHSDITCVGVSSDHKVPYVQTCDGFKVNAISKERLTICFEQPSLPACSCTFQAPVAAYSSVHPANKKVQCLDVSPGGLAVSSDSNANLHVWQTSNGEVRRRLEGHRGDVYTCRFFPSGVVILSGGADMQLKIWSAETGQCAATMTGHKAGISDTAIVDRGRNVVSCSRDGSARLWDCGKAACLRTVADCEAEINACSLVTPNTAVQLGSHQTKLNEREVATEGKLLLLACENGSLHGHALHSNTQVFRVQCSDAVNCCAAISDTLVACGTQNSQVYVYDLRNTSAPVKHLVESRGPTLSLLPHKQGFYASTGDGSCFYVNEELVTSLELTGPDCDSVYRVVTDTNHIYTAARDSLIRKYRV